MRVFGGIIWILMAKVNPARNNDISGYEFRSHHKLPAIRGQPIGRFCSPLCLSLSLSFSLSLFLSMFCSFVRSISLTTSAVSKGGWKESKRNGGWGEGERGKVC